MKQSHKLNLKKAKLLGSVFTIATFFILSLQASAISPQGNGHGTTSVQKIQIPVVETSKEPEVKQKLPIGAVSDLESADTGETSQNIEQQSARMFTAEAVTEASETFGPNLIRNASWEITDSLGNPTYWRKGGYGVNTRILAYPVAGYASSKAGKVEITSYTSGDAKWYFDDVAVTAGSEYAFSNYYTSSAESILTVRYTKSDGTFSYPTLAVLPPATSFTQASVRFVVPEGVVSLTIFHLLKKVGTLTTDEYVLQEVTQNGGGTGDENLFVNGTFESQGANGLPVGWYKGGWGTNNRTFTYPVLGVGDSKAVQVQMTSRTSGDAKWYTDYTPVTSGVYRYSDDYHANVETYLTVQYLHSDGSVRYADISLVPSTNSFKKLQANIVVSSTVTHMRVFHLLNKVGTLVIDNAMLAKVAVADNGIFSTGAVSLTFDDGWSSQYTNAVPKLIQTNISGTFYITTRQMYEQGYIGFMNKSQVLDLHNKGFEIGSHTRTHAHLMSLTTAQKINEIEGSYADLLGMGIPSVESFSYPFGEYDQSVIDIVKNAGYSSARSTLDGSVTAASDHYQLARRSVEITTTFAQVVSWIEQARESKTWLLLAFHQITDENNSQYNTKPAVFNQIVDYLVEENVRVVTVEEGMTSMAPML
jgi:peptidoglycan/xylan/chitin deacetylase (PgdA/CDA1 family)